MEEISQQTLDFIDSVVKSNKIVLFMKGDKDFPQCGFSSIVASILDKLSVEYKDINVLQDMGIRQGIKQYSDWPTIPQLYVNGEFIGGCDIVKEMYSTGELHKIIV